MKRILSKVGSTLIAALAIIMAYLTGLGIGVEAGHSAVSARYAAGILWDFASTSAGYVVLSFGGMLAAALVVAVLAAMFAAALTYSLVVPAFILGVTSSTAATLFAFAPTTVRLDVGWSTLFMGAVLLAAGLAYVAGERMRRLMTDNKWFPSTA